MPRRLVVSTTFVCAFALLVAAPVAGQGAGTNDYSSGFGYLDDAENRGSVGYEVIALAPDPAGFAAEGEFDFRRASRTGEGVGFHANALCIEADGNEAVIGLVVEQSTDPAYTPGEFLEALAVDIVDGNGGTQSGDRFDMDEESTSSAPDCEEDPDQFTLSPIRGDIVVEDSGFATLP